MILLWLCRHGECLTFWSMRINVAPLVASILIAEDLRDSLVMQRGARNGQPGLFTLPKDVVAASAPCPNLQRIKVYHTEMQVINTPPARTTPLYVPTYVVFEPLPLGIDE